MAKKVLHQVVNPDGEVLTFSKKNDENKGRKSKANFYTGVSSKVIERNFLHSLMDLDLAQNTGFRQINCTFAKSSELNRNLYMSGALMFFRSRLDGLIKYCKYSPINYHQNGNPKQVYKIPLFQTEPDKTTIYTVNVDCVIWYDNLRFTNTQSTPIPRAKSNKAFLQLSAQVLQKLTKQLKISGSRLLGVVQDTGQIEEIAMQLQDCIEEEEIVQVLANNFQIDPNVLSIETDLSKYLQILQDLNQVRQYHNGFGQGAFGTFKKERSLSTEVDTNEGNTNLVHMARVMLDQEWIIDMANVLGEVVDIQWNGGNL